MPARIGPYTVCAVLGSGGMGRIFLAERLEVYRQRVAVKVLHQPSFENDCAESLGLNASLKMEAEFLNALDHPGIVRLLDWGSTESGESYLAMEYISGERIDRFCDGARLSLRERIDLMVRVTEAVSYAHQHLVIHADLKPSNILVAADLSPKLLDFGVARHIGMVPDTNPTSASGLTPAFASPEQLAGGHITVAADLFSLGRIASLLIGGDPCAYPGPVTAAIAEARSTTPARWQRMVRGDLIAILRKATAVDPEARYTTAEAFADDLRRWLQHKPVRARPSPLRKRVALWAFRNQRSAVAAALALALLLSLVAGSVSRSLRARHERERAEQRLHALLELTGALQGEFYRSTGTLPHSEVARQSLIRSAAATLDQLASQGGGDASLQLDIAKQYRSLAEIEQVQNSSAAQAAAHTHWQHARTLLEAVPPQSPQAAKARAQLAAVAAEANPSPVR